jgi:hypothetical protein
MSRFFICVLPSPTTGGKKKITSAIHKGKNFICNVFPARYNKNLKSLAAAYKNIVEPEGFPVKLSENLQKSQESVVATIDEKMR